MNVYLVSAGLLSIALGLAHSILGEMLIFRRLRADRLTSPAGPPLLTKRHVAVLWSTWHLLTLLGWGIGAVLIWLAWQTPPIASLSTISTILSATFLISGVFWLYGTRGRHPAWIVFLLISGLLWSGA